MQQKIIHQESWSRSVEGIPIEMYKKDNTSDAASKSQFRNKKPFLFIGGVHGDEPEGVRLAQELLGWIKSETSQGKDLWPWILIPCLNVEGFKKSQRTNSRGVDLNRNFPTQNWVLSTEKNRYYNGPNAASEPEVQNLIQLIEREKPIAIFHFHSWNPCLVYTGSPGKIFADALTEGNPYQSKEDIGYPTPGSLGEWAWTVKKTPVIGGRTLVVKEKAAVWHAHNLLK